MYNYIDPQKQLNFIEFKDFILHVDRYIDQYINTHVFYNRKNVRISVLLSLILFFKKSQPNEKISFQNIYKYAICYSMPKNLRMYVATIIINILNEYKKEFLIFIYDNQKTIKTKVQGNLNVED